LDFAQLRDARDHGVGAFAGEVAHEERTLTRFAPGVARPDGRLLFGQLAKIGHCHCGSPRKKGSIRACRPLSPGIRGEKLRVLVACPLSWGSRGGGGETALYFRLTAP